MTLRAKVRARLFVRVHRDTALADADLVDALRRAGAGLHPLAGIPISTWKPQLGVAECAVLGVQGKAQ